MRPWTEKVYGIPPEQVVGSSGVVKFETGADGKPVLMKEAKIELIDEGPGKPVDINHFIHRRPIFAFGNSDGDLQMLQRTMAGGGARFAGIVPVSTGQTPRGPFGHLPAAIMTKHFPAWIGAASCEAALWAIRSLP